MLFIIIIIIIIFFFTYTNNVTSLRRRFEQNQEDATYTIMALLPTLSSDIIDTFPVEALTQELQAKRTEKAILRSSSKALSDATSDISNVTTGLVPKNTSDEDTKAENEEDSIVMKQEAGSESIVQVEKAPKKSKTQLWQELKIECMWLNIIEYCYGSN